MSRWIDVEWLMNFFVDIPNNFTLTIGNLRATVNDAPTINIVRCRECKHWTNGDDTYGICYRCANTRQMKTDDFCSYGSRSEKPNNLERSE